MSISSLKQGILLPERELVIGRNFIYQGKAAFLASVTEQDGNTKLWIFQQAPEFNTAMSGFPFNYATNRDEIQGRVSRNKTVCNRFSGITIQGVHMPFSRSNARIVGQDPMSFMKLQHFIEAGVDFSSIEHISFDDLVLGEYQLADGVAFPKFDTSAPITLHIGEEIREVIIEPFQSLNLEIGEQTKDKTCSFSIPAEDKEVKVYIDRVVRHDIRKQAEGRFNDEVLESICPKGHEQLLIQYECQENIQLNFYPTEFLNSAHKRANNSFSGMVFSSTDEDSVHGYPVHTALLKTVPAGYSGSVDVELVSWFKRIQGDTIEI